MGFWDQLKSLFGFGTPQPVEGPSPSPAPAAPPPAPPAAAVPPATVSTPASAKAPAAPAEPAQNPYAAGEILGLSADEMRKRALAIDPYRTVWIGRVDTIPPQSDERTALIDRGLILRGLLTPQQIAEIHRVGDLWLRHHDAATLARTLAAKSAEQAVEEERKRKATKKKELRRLAAERKERRIAALARRRAEDIIFLGRGVSSKLGDRRSHVEKLQQAGLPVLCTPADVAKALGVSVPRLRWLCFHSEATERTHYTYFQVPKRSGGLRLLAAPHQSLANAQKWILDNVLAGIPVTDQAHGFVKKRSTVTGALPHVGKRVLVNLDLKDFFPSLTFPRIRGVFQSLGYSPAAATVLALLCTECPRTAVDHDGRRIWAAVGDRSLPQGACTSPTLSNLAVRKLDRRLRGMSRKLGWEYTRYADDLTFSTQDASQLCVLMSRAKHILQEEGLRVNLKKGRVQRSGGRQEVTGIVVNRKPSIPRNEVRELRAILHGAKKTGLAAQNRKGIPHFEAWLRGKIAYLRMVDPDKGAAMQAKLEAL